MRATIRWYVGFAVIVVSIAGVALVLANLPVAQRLLGADKVQGTLIGALFGAFAGLPLKEIQDRHNKILLLDLLAEEYEQMSILRDILAVERLEQRCQQITEKILAG